jgi:hypothetical protein
LKTHLLPLLLALAGIIDASGAANLVPNPDFSDPKDPMATWRTYFPWESEWYAVNGNYVKPATMDGRTCAFLDFPPSVAAFQGGKIESAFFKIEPGAKYRAQVDLKILGGAVKIFTEAWTTDPDAGIQHDKWRVPAAADHPALVTFYRAQFTDSRTPDPRGAGWCTASREFTVPKVAYVKGKQQVPEYMTFKVVVFGGGNSRVYVTNFRVTKIP